ncbi:MAG: bifunctional proline dehydrogenase/L-glutamate gamma-semialdehyde dehydrogenase, partial [Actinomycetota bacterium]
MEADPAAVDDAQLTADAVRLAAALVQAAHREESGAAGRRRRRLARLVADPDSRAFVQTLTDQVPRIHDPARAAERFHDAVARRGIPAFAGPLDRAALALGARVAPLLPRPVMALVDRRLRSEAAGIVLPGEDPGLARHLERRRAEGFAQNVNPLGEAVLGEDEATVRLESVVSADERDDVDYVSVKITSIHSQVDPLAFDRTVEILAERLRTLYRAAARATTPAFVNLDMEAYDDLHLTVAAFRAVLDEDEFASTDAGIVLQAYLPDSGPVLEDLASWAAARHRRSGGRIKVRLVKGANLAMESVEADMEGWTQAPYASKAEVDAQFKHLLDVALADRWEGALRVGVASHNLFDVAWALTVAEARGCVDRVEVEMLEGMAPAQADAVLARAGRVLLYAPIVAHHDFEAAIAYLVRRLDENAAPDNFLRHLFELEVGTGAWDDQRIRFEAAVRDRHGVSQESRRRQDRSHEPHRTDLGDGLFENAPDTDWSRQANRRWLAAHHEARRAGGAGRVRPIVGGEPVTDGAVREVLGGGGAVVRARVTEADSELVERTVARARRAAEAWRAGPEPARRRALLAVADTLAAHRGEAMAIMADEGGKTARQADPEVSEAVDFARWYAGSGRLVDRLGSEGVTFEPYPVTVVASPWNFPFAIPTGGVTAALAAGSAVILKPAPEAVATAELIVRCCLDAGVPPDLIALLPTPEDEVGRRLLTHPDVGGVVLTGAFDTARLFTSWDPQRRLHAETSGKNAMVITATADLDAAIADLVHSAFG